MNSIDIHVQVVNLKDSEFIAEAMAHELLVCDSCWNTLYNGKNGWLVKPKNPTKLIALERALDEIQGNNWNKRHNGKNDNKKNW